MPSPMTIQLLRGSMYLLSHLRKGVSALFLEHSKKAKHLRGFSVEVLVLTQH